MLYIIILILIILILPFAIASLSLAPWLPTRREDLERVRDISKLKPNEIFFELGCGTGISSFHLAKHFPRSKIVGIELAFPLYFFCKIKNLFKRNKNLKFQLGNIYRKNLSSADVVYFFSRGKDENNKVRKKLEKDLRPGARVISYAFPILGWKPVEINKPNKKDITIYLYNI